MLFGVFSLHHISVVEGIFLPLRHPLNVTATKSEYPDWK